jgi:hypothetical protein
MFKTVLFSAAFSLIAGISAADGFGFMSPSGNIYCNGYISDGGRIDCSIINRQGPTALARPSSCTQSWGHTYSVEGRGQARMTCSRVPGPVNYTDIATYGLTAQFGDITCTSESTGLTCRNAAGHGFFLSRRQQNVF